MAVNSLSSINGVYPSSSQQEVKSQLNIDKDAFLKILITELTNQDPLDPLKDRDFIAQLAQLSQLEQVVNMNSSISNMISALSSSMNFMNLSSSASLIGRVVQAEGLSSTVVRNGEFYPVEVESDRNGILNYGVYDSSGKLLFTGSMVVDSGRTFVKPDVSLPDGVYRLNFDFKTQDGSNAQLKVYGWSVVDGATIENNSVKLLAGSDSFEFKNIKVIK